MKLLCILFGHRWYYWTEFRGDQHRHCIHRQCWHCLKLQVNLRQPEEEMAWWSTFDTKLGKLMRS